MQRTRWELVDLDKEEKEKEKDKQPTAAPLADNGGSPGGLPPVEYAGDGKIVGGGPIGGPPTGGGAASSAPAPTPGAPSGLAGVPGGNAVVSRPPDANGFIDTGEFAVRVDRATRLPNGDVDLAATLKTRSPARKLVGNGDWRAFATDEDGVSMDTNAIYMPGDGPLRPFAEMPYVSASAPAQVRFRVVMGAGMGAVRSATIMWDGTASATFPVGPLSASGPVPSQTSAAPYGRLKWFEVRYDDVRLVGRTTELSFTARNHTDKLQYAAGTNLTFVGTGADGRPVDNTGRVHALRGPLGRQLEGVSVLPGQTARFRVVFDKPGVRGPITVKDGATTATPPLPAAPEPAW